MYKLSIYYCYQLFIERIRAKSLRSNLMSDDQEEDEDNGIDDAY